MSTAAQTQPSNFIARAIAAIGAYFASRQSLSDAWLSRATNVAELEQMLRERERAQGRDWLNG